MWEKWEGKDKPEDVAADIHPSNHNEAGKRAKLKQHFKFLCCMFQWSTECDVFCTAAHQHVQNTYFDGVYFISPKLQTEYLPN